MTTNQSTSVDFEIPEELPERSFASVYKVVEAFAAYPPERLAARRATPQVNLHVRLAPQDFRYNSDRSLGFEDDDEHLWLAMFDKNGEISKVDSNFGIWKAAAQKLGFMITNASSVSKLVGKMLICENRRITRTFKQTNAQGEEEDVANDSYLLIPIGIEADDYVHVGPMRTFDRPRKKGATTSAASQTDNASVALPKLRQVLNGKNESEYFNAMLESKDTDVNRPPYITEASSDQAALTSRMLEAGMRLIEGRLVN